MAKATTSDTATALSPFHLLTAVMKAKKCAADAAEALGFPPDNFTEEQGEIAVFVQLQGAYGDLVSATSYLRQVMMTIDPKGKLHAAYERTLDADSSGSGEEPDEKTIAKLNEILGRVEP